MTHREEILRQSLYTFRAVLMDANFGELFVGNIRFLLDLLPRLKQVDFAVMDALEKRMLQMFYVTIWGKTAADWSSDEVLDNLYALADSPMLLCELLELLRIGGGINDGSSGCFDF